MKIAVAIVRAIVGILFIISGLVKANDPLGLSYKMQEFFELWNTSLSSSKFFLARPMMALFEYFHDHSLMLSVIMIALEILAGAALLLGWQKKLILRSLLVLIVFFTFLTAYAYLSGKFKNCGCFGDCLPITPITSFLKDVALLVFILFLLFTQRYIEPLFTNAGRRFFMLCTLALSVGLQWYVLNYLPLVDCLPFKKGNNISQQMKIPAGALPDSFAIRFVYEKGGKKFEFSPETLPADLASYKYVDRIDKLVRKGKAEAPIKGFSLTGGSADSTEIILNQPKALLVICDIFRDSESRLNDLKNIRAAAQQKKIPVYIVTSASIPVVTRILNNNGLGDIQVFSCDNTAVRTAARTNPTFYLIQQGTIISKYSYCQAGKTIANLKKQ
jgi:uncharacterized membrane protein YphA (DoxX/SURF4 family)